MTKVRFCVLAIVLALWPAAAQAQEGFWDFLEGFSGPGPFNYGFVVEARPVCLVTTKTAPDKKEVVGLWGAGPDGNYPCLTKTKDVHSYVNLRVGRATSDVKGLFSDKPLELTGQIAVNAVQGLIMRQIDPAISVGAGVGALWFTGATLDSNVPRFIVTPLAVSLTPLRVLGANHRWARLVVFNFEENAVFGALTASSFNKNSTSAFVAHADMVRSFSVTFDLLTLAKP